MPKERCSHRYLLEDVHEDGYELLASQVRSASSHWTSPTFSENLSLRVRATYHRWSVVDGFPVAALR